MALEPRDLKRGDERGQLAAWRGQRETGRGQAGVRTQTGARFAHLARDSLCLTLMLSSMVSSILSSARVAVTTLVCSVCATAMLLTVFPPATAQSQTLTPALQFSGALGSSTSFTSTRGYSFDVTATGGIAVSALSVYDAGADGLSQSHDVGLWDTAGTLLAFATIPAGTLAPLDTSGLFRYVPIAPVTLTVGTSYAVGAFFLVNSADQQAFNFSNIVAAPGIQYDEARYSNNGASGLSFPATAINSFSGEPGGSFDVGIVPEPSAGLLMAGGLFALVGIARLRGRARTRWAGVQRFSPNHFQIGIIQRHTPAGCIQRDHSAQPRLCVL